MSETALTKDTVLSPRAIRRALALTERSIPSIDEAARSSAAERVARWRASCALQDDSRFAQRLADVGLTASDFHALLATADTPPDDDATDEPPRWSRRLAAAYQDDPSPSTMPLGDLAASPDRDLIAPARQLLDHSWRTLIEALDAVTAATPGLSIGASADLAGMLAAPLTLDVHRMLSRASILELQIARFEERLEGDTPETRFAAFVDEMTHAAGALRFFEQYPVLARDLSMCGEEISCGGADSGVGMVGECERFSTSTLRSVSPIAKSVSEMARSLGG